MFAKNTNITIERNTALLIILGLISIVIKILIAIPFKGPILFFDEFYYKENALAMINFGYHTNHYPPLYSIFLMLGFSIENYYLGFKILNVFISSLIIFPVWLIAKELLSRNNILVVCIISLFLPFHFVYNKMVMSENLYYPILLMFVYSFYKHITTYKIKWAILTGLFLGLCLLTRYFSIVLIPVYFIVVIADFLIFRKSFNREVIKKILFHIGVTLGIFALIFGLFFISSSEDFFKTSSIYTKKVTHSKSEFRWLNWIVIYFAYAITLFIPFVSLVLNNISKKLFLEDKKYFAYLSIIFTLTISFILLASYHSTGGNFVKKYMNGRYILYIGMPWIIFSFYNFNINKDFIKNVILSLLSIVLVVLSYKILNGDIYNTADWLLIPHMSPNGYVFVNNFSFFLIFLIIVIIISFFSKITKHLWIVFILFFIINAKKNNNILDDPIGIHGNEIINYVDKRKNMLIYNGTQCFDYQYHHFLNFWGYYDSKVKPLPKSFKDCQSGLIVLPNKISRNVPINKYTFKGKQFYIYKTPLNFSENTINLFTDSISTIEFINKTVRNDNSYKANIAFINDSSQIFALDNSLIKIHNNIKDVGEYKLYAVFGFHPDSKNWGISDGMNFTITYKDSLQEKKLVEKYLMPKDEDFEIYIDIPNRRSETFQLELSTYKSGKHNKGDWGCWKLLELEQKKL